MIGQRFGRLVVLERLPSEKGYKRILCLCDCGVRKSYAQDNVRRGVSKSCGCYKREVSVLNATKHGMAHKGTYETWAGMIARTTYSKHISWKNYGGRGVKVCDRWLNSYENFYKDMGDRPFPKAVLDRIDNDGDYTPENCHWTTTQKNSWNMRKNKMLTFNGETLCIAEWAAKIKLSYKTLRGRLDSGWSVEDALTTPLMELGAKRSHYVKHSAV